MVVHYVCVDEDQRETYTKDMSYAEPPAGYVTVTVLSKEEWEKRVIGEIKNNNYITIIC